MEQDATKHDADASLVGLDTGLAFGSVDATLHEMIFDMAEQLKKKCVEAVKAINSGGGLTLDDVCREVLRALVSSNFIMRGSRLRYCSGAAQSSAHHTVASAVDGSIGPEVVYLASYPLILMAIDVAVRQISLELLPNITLTQRQIKKCVSRVVKDLDGPRQAAEAEPEADPQADPGSLPENGLVPSASVLIPSMRVRILSSADPVAQTGQPKKKLKLMEKEPKTETEEPALD